MTSSLELSRATFKALSSGNDVDEKGEIGLADQDEDSFEIVWGFKPNELSATELTKDMKSIRAKVDREE